MYWNLYCDKIIWKKITMKPSLIPGQHKAWTCTSWISQVKNVKHSFSFPATFQPKGFLSIHLSGHKMWCGGTKIDGRYVLIKTSPTGHLNTNLFRFVISICSGSLLPSTVLATVKTSLRGLLLRRLIYRHFGYCCKYVVCTWLVPAHRSLNTPCNVTNLAVPSKIYGYCFRLSFWSVS